MLMAIILYLNLSVTAKDCIGNCPLESFSKAKKLLRSQVYFDRRETFYCATPFDEKLNLIADKSYKAKNPKSKRSKKVEWEHVVPAHAFGQNFKEWREGDASCQTKKGKKFKGRNCARKSNKIFRQMEADPYNLVPAIGELNSDRSNFSFAEIAEASKKYGECDFKIKDRKVEPRDAVKGDIARVYFYMQLTYPQANLISRKNKSLFEAWDKLDPVDTWECLRFQRIKNATGMNNPILEKACK